MNPRASNTPIDARFDKAKRLLNAAHYSKVFEENDARASHRHLLLLGRCNQGEHNRLGLVVAKKHVRLAVQRNRIKRLAREVFRKLPSQPPTLDVVLLARKGIAELDNEELSSILLQQWQKLQKQIAKNRSD
ncbi:MAG: ribonuclease P protein component [Halioglobus sp.]